MTTNSAVNRTPYLRTSRHFPEVAQPLSVELTKSYIDIAAFVNDRIIGLFPKNNPAITGERWFLGGAAQQQQTLRQVYTFTANGNIPHGITLTTISGFTRCWGSFTDGTNWYGVIWGTTVTIAGQVTFYITPTNIVVQSGAGAPAITSGTIVLEWLSQV